MDEKTVISSTPAVWPGWRTGKKLGEGSYGAVYEIHRTVDGVEEKAALKVMSIPQSSAEAASMQEEGYSEEEITHHFLECLRDIEREYQIMDEIRGHRNIVHCDDLRKLEHADTYGWDIYIKMELLTPMMRYLEGKYGGRLILPEEEVLKVGMDLCNALVACAEHKLIHRDIKPQNILVSDEGDYKLGDFGTARTIESSTGLTGGIGTKNYMSPEVAASWKYDYRADIYSTGLVLYWMLNERRLPFNPLPPAVPSHKVTTEALQRRLEGEPLPPPAHGSEELQQIVLKACAYEKDSRWASAREMLDAISSIYEKYESAYNAAFERIKTATSSEEMTACAQQLEALGDYRLAETLAAKCREKATEFSREEQYQRILRAMNEAVTPENYMNCAELFHAIGSYKQAERLSTQCLERAEQLRAELAERQRLEELEAAYRSALHQMQQAKSAEDYRSAAEAFAELAEYSDAAAQIQKCRDAAAELQNRALYKQAAAAAKTKDKAKLQSAIELFERLGDYQDSAQQAELCRQKLEQLQKRENGGGKKKSLPVLIVLLLVMAIGTGAWFGISNRKNIKSADNGPEMMDSVASEDAGEDSGTAEDTSADLADYEDVEHELAEDKPVALRDAEVGKYVIFGRYEQDNDTANGPEEIEWLVLAKEDNKALLISRYALDCMPYNEEIEEVTWETCSLRSWLNEDFLGRAFTTAEQSGIITTTVKANQNPAYSTDLGNDTQDKVFMLDISEAENYFSNDEARECEPTKYAIANGAENSIGISGTTTCYWWLRSPSNYSACESLVTIYGQVFADGCTVIVQGKCVRPALWVSTDIVGTDENTSSTDETAGHTGYEHYELGKGMALDVDIIDPNRATVTLSGISLKESYTTSGRHNTNDCSWEVTLNNQETKSPQVGTVLWTFDKVKETSLEQMDTNIWAFDGEMFAYVKSKISMSHTSDSITWQFEISPNEDIDLTKTTSYTISMSEYSNSYYYDKEVERAVAQNTSGQNGSLSLTANVGDYITFGTYPQTATGNDRTPIEWLVLAKEDNRALLISRYVLDCTKYNEEKAEVTWENCSLRSWLNKEFLGKAFSSAEQNGIIPADVKADQNPKYSSMDPGEDTQDQVFLLSIQELERYFSSDRARKCTPTRYAKTNGTYGENYTTNGASVDGATACWWWLRTPGSNSSRAAYIDQFGTVGRTGYDVNSSIVGVRPAMWVRLKSES